MGFDLRTIFLLLLPLSPWAGITALDASTYRFDDTASELVVHVPKAGLLRFLGHDHEIAVTAFEGVVVHGRAGSVEPRLTFLMKAEDLDVKDPDLDEDDRREVRETMLGEEVLAREANPLIRFESTAVEIADEGQWEVEGLLTIRGISREIRFSAEVADGVPGELIARGRVEIRPEDFGISPVSAGGGTVRTADVIRLEFRVHAKEESE